MRLHLERRRLAAVGVLALTGLVGIPVTVVALQMPDSGFVEVCKMADGTSVTGVFQFMVGGTTTDVPVGACSPVISVPAGTVTVTENARAGISVSNVQTIPAGRLVSSDLAARSAQVQVVAGDESTQTTVTFTNRSELALVKICKVAGAGVAVGTNVSFTAGTIAVSVPAGSPPGGTCAVAGWFPVATNLVISETVPFGTEVSSITVAPGDRLVGSPNPAGGSVVVRVGSGATEVTFTNRVPTPSPSTTTTTVPGGGGASTTTVPGGGGGTTTTTLPGGGGGTTTTTLPGGGAETTTTTVPGGGGASTTTVPGGGGASTTTVPGGGGASTTTLPGGGGASTTTVPGGGGGTTTTTVPGGGGATTTVATSGVTTTTPGGGGVTTTVGGGMGHSTTTAVPATSVPPGGLSTSTTLCQTTSTTAPLGGGSPSTTLPPGPAPTTTTPAGQGPSTTVAGGGAPTTTGAVGQSTTTIVGGGPGATAPPVCPTGSFLSPAGPNVAVRESGPGPTAAPSQLATTGRRVGRLMLLGCVAVVLGGLLTRTEPRAVWASVGRCRPGSREGSVTPVRLHRAQPGDPGHDEPDPEPDPDRRPDGIDGDPFPALTFVPVVEDDRPEEDEPMRLWALVGEPDPEPGRGPPA